MKHFINIKDIPSKDLRKILDDAKKRKIEEKIQIHLILIKINHLVENY